MKYLKTICTAILAVLAVSAIAAATANAALPTVLLLTNEKTAEFSGTLTEAGAGALRSALGEVIASLVLTTLSVADMKELGTTSFLFKGSKLGEVKCNSPGDSEANGEILVDNAEYHLVLGLSGELLALILLPEIEGVRQVKFNCGTVKFKVTGSQLIKVSPFGKETQALLVEALCLNTTTPNWLEYDNDSATMSTGRLQANIGTGPVNACELIAKPITLKTTQMGGEIMEP